MAEGDPRIDRTRQHVLACARDMLLAHGAHAVTFSALARRARVSRNTLYRHWVTPEHLLVDVALRYHVDQVGRAEPPRNVPAFLRALRDNLRSPGTVEVLTELIARAERDRTSEQVLQQVAALRQRVLASATGPLTDAQFARIVGPVFYQALIARRPVDDTFLEEILAALGPFPAVEAGRS
jgi:AcrR family transcriptional regulator